MPAKKLIIFAPHPDDETLGCGGILAKRIEEGYEPIIVLITDGRGLFTHYGIKDNPSPQKVADARLEETIQALKILGCGEEAIIGLDIENGKLKDHQEAAIQMVAEILIEHRPDEIYVTNKHEAHLEHQLSHAIVKSASSIAAYKGPCYQYIVGLHYKTPLESITQKRVAVDVAPYAERKRAAVNCFRYHLDIISIEQEKPFVESFDHFVQAEEIFFVG